MAPVDAIIVRLNYGLKSMTDNAFKGRLQAALKNYRKLPKPPLGKCMWWKSECQQPVSSHSVSRAWLERIAHDGHVLNIRANVDVARQRTDIVAEPIGINVASVFPGFCAEHDSNIFRPIDPPFNTCIQRQCDLLVFRSICREAYTKYMVASFNISQGMVEDHPTPYGKITLEMMLCATDLLAYKVGLEQALDNGTSDYCHYVIEFSRTPNVTGTGTFDPKMSFDSLALSGRLEWITVSILPATFGGIAVLSWKNSHHEKPVALLDSLLRVKTEWISDVLLRFVIDNVENAFYSPVWWRGMALDKQAQILQRYEASLIMPHTDTKGIYETKGTPLVDWSPIRMYPV